MRHNVSTKKLNRAVDHRNALMKNLSVSLVEHGNIETTLAKAKYLRPFIEKLVTKAKKGDQASVRLLRSRLGNEVAVRKLIDNLGPMFKDRNGGYTRIKKLAKRDGDKALMARIEFLIERKRKTTPVTEPKEKEATTTKEVQKSKKPVEAKKEEKLSEKVKDNE